VGANVQHLTSFLIDDSLVLDAGSVGLSASAEALAFVRDVVISHSHIDHIASLPFLVETLLDRPGGAPTIHASGDVIDCLKRDIFNDRVWPDFTALRDGDGRPLLTFHEVRAGDVLDLGRHRITMVEMDHVVPTLGAIVEDETTAIVYSSDTAPTDELWRLATENPRLAAVFLEATFPNDLGELAAISKHLTVERFAIEIEKIPAHIPVYAIHLKPKYAARVANEIRALRRPNVHICVPGAVYDFDPAVAGARIAR
jgi:ribonuclease BN (tRNA processing enzyme)